MPFTLVGLRAGCTRSCLRTNCPVLELLASVEGFDTGRRNGEAGRGTIGDRLNRGTGGNDLLSERVAAGLGIVRRYMDDFSKSFILSP
jgi:hypothetical protein